MFANERRRLRMQSIVAETIEFYKTNPRGMQGDSCVYLCEEDNSMCAVGRCLIDPGAIDEVASVGGIWTDDRENVGQPIALSDRRYRFLDHALKPKYRGLPLIFWSALQTMHDSTPCWTLNNEGGQDWVGTSAVKCMSNMDRLILSLTGGGPGQCAS